MAEYGFSGYHVITRSYDDLTGYLNKELERLNSDEVKKKREQAEELARKWKYYYKAILRNLNIYKKMKTNAPQTGSSYTEFKGYQMGDMDGDGIPELIIDMYAQNVKSAGCFIFSYKDGRSIRKAGKETYDETFYRSEQCKRCDRIIRLSSHYNIYHHISDTYQDFVHYDRKTFFKVFGGEPFTSGKVRLKSKKEGMFVLFCQYDNNCDIEALS